MARRCIVTAAQRAELLRLHRISLRKPVRLRTGGMRLVRPHPGGRRSPAPLAAARGYGTIVRVGDCPYRAEGTKPVLRWILFYARYQLNLAGSAGEASGG